MRTFFAHAVLAITTAFAFPVYAHAQSTDAGHGLTFHLGWDGSVTTFDQPHDDGSNQLTSFSGLSLGLSFDLPSGINPIVQVSGQQLKEPLRGMVSDSQAWYFMGGVFLENRNHPFYVNLLVGLNRHMYNFGSELDEVFETVNNFSSEVEFGYEVFVVNAVPIRIAMGMRDPINTGVGLDTIFFKVGTAFSINLF